MVNEYRIYWIINKGYIVDNIKQMYSLSLL